MSSSSTASASLSSVARLSVDREALSRNLPEGVQVIYGPVGETASIQPAQPQAPGDEVVVGGNVSVAPPADQVDPLAMPAPEVATAGMRSDASNVRSRASSTSSVAGCAQTDPA